MAPPACTAHPDRAAEFRCPSCRRRLCPACVEAGHRLFICRHCRERALPLDAEAPVATNAYQRERRLDRPYGFADALRYPFRGLGRYLVPVWVATLFAAGLLGTAASLVVHAIVALLVPGLLLEIVRTTAAGEDELPDWPDYAEPIARFGELLCFFLIAAVTLAPVWVAARLAHLSLLDLLAGRAGAGAAALLLAALGVGLCLGVFAFGSSGAYASGWLGFRIDLHLEALLSPAGPPGLRAAGIVLGLAALRLLLGALLAPLPLLGGLVSDTLGAYALVLAAHFVGLLFRRHRATLDAIYRD